MRTTSRCPPDPDASTTSTASGTVPLFTFPYLYVGPRHFFNARRSKGVRFLRASPSVSSLKIAGVVELVCLDSVVPSLYDPDEKFNLWRQRPGRTSNNIWHNYQRTIENIFELDHSSLLVRHIPSGFVPRVLWVFSSAFVSGYMVDSFPPNKIGRLLKLI